MINDVIIMGGGLMGFSTALQLSLQGKQCLVIERDSPGRHASGVNAGGLRRLNRHPAEIPMSLAAANMWRNITNLLGSDCDACFPGQIRVAENQADMAKLAQRAKLVGDLGFEHETLITKKQLYQQLPALSPHCVGGLICKGDGFARPFHALTAFRQTAINAGSRYGGGLEVINIQHQNNLWQVTTDQGKFNATILVNCAGAWGAKIADWVGEKIPLQPKAPMMMVTERLPRFIEPVVGAASRKLSFKQMQNGTVLIGGAHLATLNYEQQVSTMDWSKLAVSARAALALFPQLKHAHIVRTWAGIEGFTPDNLPIIGQSSVVPRLFHCFGFSAHGFQLSPIMGVIMADLILKGETDFDLTPFAVNRFN